MSAPTVAAVMLVNGRDAMTRRAVECVRAQTYGNLSIVVLDTGGAPRESIGELRNRANALTSADIIVHFDSDDYSHPGRVAEQVALLEASGADAVGYNEALFWREHRHCNCAPDALYQNCMARAPAAWLYANGDPRFCLGASLAYWRRAWARKPFAATSQGEDFRFCLGLRTVGVSSVRVIRDFEQPPVECKEPRFIARIHAGNTSNAYRGIENASEWRRVAEWDAYCRERMAL
jgi:glycosyltransferase involved in cell wall biosynthesis